MSTKRMTPHELRVRMAWLGLRPSTLATKFHCRPDTVRRWLSGRDPIPYGVPGDLDVIKAYADRWVEIGLRGDDPLPEQPPRDMNRDQWAMVHARVRHGDKCKAVSG